MSESEHRRIVAVDFDGTLAKTRFPVIIEPIQQTIRYCKQLKKDGAILILYTCRKGKDLQDAVEWCRVQGLTFDYVNENTAENIADYGETRKIFAHEYIDDRAVNPNRKMWKLRMHIISACESLATAILVILETVIKTIRVVVNQEERT